MSVTTIMKISCLLTLTAFASGSFQPRRRRAGGRRPGVMFRHPAAGGVALPLAEVRIGPQRGQACAHSRAVLA